MFSIPVILAFTVGVLATLSIVNIFIRRMKCNKQEAINTAAKNCEETKMDKGNENCWCCEDDLNKDQIAEIFEKHGVKLCGKNTSRIIMDNKIDHSISKKMKVNKSTISAN